MKLTEYMSITLNEKTCLSVSRRQCPTERSDLLGTERCDLLSVVVRMHRLELCWTDKKSEFFPNVGRKLRNTNSRLITIEEVYENWVKLLNLSMKNFTAVELKNFNDEVNNFFMNGYCSKIQNCVKHQKSLTEIEELKKFQSSTFDTFATRRLVEDQDTILELTGRVQDLQHEINCMNDSKDFQDAESVRSGNSHVTSRPVSFPPHPISEGMLSPSFGVRAAVKGRQAFGTHMVHLETFLQIQMRHHQHLILKNCINGIRPKSRSIRPQWRKVKCKNKIKI